MIARLLLAGLLLAAPLAASEPKPAGSPSAPGYQPIGRDEQGLWAEAEEGERELKTSRLVIREPSVNAYLRRVLCREVGDAACASVRLYLVRAPIFNADMGPSGVLRVYSGLLLRSATRRNWQRSWGMNSPILRTGTAWQTCESGAAPPAGAPG